MQNLNNESEITCETPVCAFNSGCEKLVLTWTELTRTGHGLPQDDWT